MEINASVSCFLVDSTLYGCCDVAVVSGLSVSLHHLVVFDHPVLWLCSISFKHDQSMAPLVPGGTKKP